MDLFLLKKIITVCVRRELDELDRMLLEWLVEKDFPFSLVVTKADKEGRGRLTQKKATLQRTMGSDDVFLFSSKDGYGRKELLSHIASVLRPVTS